MLPFHLDNTTLGTSDVMMTSLVGWLMKQNDVTHHLLVDTATAATIPLLRALPESSMGGVCLLSVGTQLGMYGCTLYPPPSEVGPINF